MDIRLSIFVALHKQCPHFKDDTYVPIQVGKSLTEEDFGILHDNTGDHISEKHDIFCEHTATYWAWKNMDADYYGLCHYRRFFTLESPSFSESMNRRVHYLLSKSFGNLLRPGTNYAKSELVYTRSFDHLKLSAQRFSDHIRREIEGGRLDACFCKPYQLSGMNIRQYMSQYAGVKNIDYMFRAVELTHPEYLKYVETTLAHHQLYSSNMYVMSKSIFDEYCYFLFDVLNRVVELLYQEGQYIDVLKEKSCFLFCGYLGEILTSSYCTKLLADGKRVQFFNVMMFNS